MAIANPSEEAAVAAPLPVGGATHGRLPLGRKLAYGTGGFAEALMADAVLAALFPFYNIVLKVDALVLGGLLVLPRLYDAFTDPLMGHVSDRTRSRWGRRRPYIAGGSVLLALATLFVWNPPGFIPDDSLGTYLLAMLFVFSTASTIVFVPYYGLGAELSTDYNERSRIMAYRAAFTRVAAALANLTLWFAYLSWFSGPRQGFAVVGAILAIVPLVALWVVVLGVREPRVAASIPTEISTDSMPKRFVHGLREIVQNRPFVVVALAGLLFIFGVFCSLPLVTYINFYYVCAGDETSASFFSSWYGFTWHISGLAFIPLVTWISTHIGKQGTFGLGMISFGVISLLSWFFFVPGLPYLQFLFPILLGFGLATFLVMPTSMLADVCDYDEVRTGRRREGVYFGFFTFLFKAGFSFTSLITGISLQWAGFVADAEAQAPETIVKLRLLLMFLPMAIITLSGIALFMYPLTRERVEAIQATLSARRASAQHEVQAPAQ